MRSDLIGLKIRSSRYRMNKELCRTNNEFRCLSLRETEKGYWLHADDYLGGEVSSESDWFFPRDNLPDELLTLLCEADFAKLPLSHEHDSLLWDLTYMDDYSA